MEKWSKLAEVKLGRLCSTRESLLKHKDSLCPSLRVGLSVIWLQKLVGGPRQVGGLAESVKWLVEGLFGGLIEGVRLVTGSRSLAEG